MNMRDIIALCEGTGAKFALQPKLDPKNYIMTPSMAQVARWKAKTYLANSGEKKGAMAHVGYIMISLKDNTIIPISHGDEHHNGYDLLHALARKFKFDEDDYVAVRPDGNNYIYNQRDIPTMLNVLSKYLAYGGQDGTVIGTNDMNGKAVTISYFVKAKGNMTIKPKQLAPIGQMVIDHYKTLADALETARGSFQKSARAKVFAAAQSLLEMLNRYVLLLRDLPYEQLQADIKALPQLQANDDVEGVEQLFFGFHSVKNALHNKLRAARERVTTGKKDWFDADRLSVWGDLDQAIDLLGRF